MPVVVEVDGRDADHQAGIAGHVGHCRRGPWAAPLLVIGLCAVMLAGCNHAGRSATGPGRTSVAAAPSSHPLPARALLRPQPEPDCRYKGTDGKIDGNTDSKTADVQRLDYERQCYRHAEMIARHRLRLLQNSVSKTIRSVNQQSAQSGT
jgi:hypothetical protein